MVDVPPPPENPFMSENPDANFTSVEDAETLDQGRPSVAATPGKAIILVGVLGLVVFVLLYTIFSGGKKKDVVKEEKPRAVPMAQIEAPPPLPVDPVVTAPPVSIIAPPIPEPTNLQIIKPEDNGAAKAQALERMRSKMFVTDSGSSLGGALGGGKSDEAPKASPSDPNSVFAANVIAANTKAERVEATQIGDLRHTIAQGRIIPATMESALNTDLPAPIRAIVSRDVYGEAGTEALIPKGSRLIGSYNTDVSGGQSRVFVIWTRVLRPDGVDVALGSPLVDQIGQAGVSGQVDTKFQAVFSRSVLSSVMSIAFAIGSDKVSGGSTTTTNSGVGSTTTGDAATTATTQALSQLGSTMDSFIQRFIDARPTILVDQGTPVNVFVNRDLVFPVEFSPTGGRIIN